MRGRGKGVQPINLPSSAIVYGAVKSEIVLEELWAVTRHLLTDKFINMVLSSKAFSLSPILKQF